MLSESSVCMYKNPFDHKIQKTYGGGIVENLIVMPQLVDICHFLCASYTASFMCHTK